MCLALRRLSLAPNLYPKIKETRLECLMRTDLTLLTGVAAGAGLMFLLDPNRGADRRALVRDKMARAAHQTSDAIATTARDLQNRTSGASAMLRGLRRQDPVADDVLLERVRSKMGRFTSHLRAIDVFVNQGTVALQGQILRPEHDRLRRAIRSVRGVRSVEDRLQVFDPSDHVPSLQGGIAPPGEPFELWQRNWAPAVRLLAGMAGGAGAAFGFVTRGGLGAVLGVVGLGLAARAATNRP
jgi:hypothetical protein